MIEMLRETTGAVGNFAYPPHVYYLNKRSGRMVAFHPVNGELKIYEGKGYSFSKRYRTFEKLGEVEEL